MTRRAVSTPRTQWKGGVLCASIFQVHLKFQRCPCHPPSKKCMTVPHALGAGTYSSVRKVNNPKMHCGGMLLDVRDPIHMSGSSPIGDTFSGSREGTVSLEGRICHARVKKRVQRMDRTYTHLFNNFTILSF